MNFTPAHIGRTVARWLVVLSLMVGIGGSIPGIPSSSPAATFRKTEVTCSTARSLAYRVRFTSSPAVVSGNGSFHKQLRLHSQDALLKCRLSQQHTVSSRHKLGLSHHKITRGSSDESPLLIG